MEARLEIKVCGLRDVQGARAAVEAGADWLGLVLAPSVRRIGPEEARAMTAQVGARWVGVFVDAEPRTVGRMARDLGLAAVQLHGGETLEACRAAREESGVPVWKAVRWTGDAAVLGRWAGVADRVVLDAGAGSGRPLPWEEIAERIGPPEARPGPWFLAGGLAADNVGRAVTALRPDGVDASTRLESAPGVKDPERVRAFVVAARAVDRELARPAERP